MSRPSFGGIPQVCVVDGLAYDNPPESLRAKRWQDVEELLAAGVSVLASVNLQHIAEYRESGRADHGQARPAETIPKDFLKFAEEIEVVDAPPEMCLERASDTPLPDGNASEGSAIVQEQRLSQLREMALIAYCRRRRLPIGRVFAPARHQAAAGARTSASWCGSPLAPTRPP